MKEKFPQTFINRTLNCRYVISRDAFGYTVKQTKFGKTSAEDLETSLTMKAESCMDLLYMLEKHETWERAT